MRCRQFLPLLPLRVCVGVLVQNTKMIEKKIERDGQQFECDRKQLQHDGQQFQQSENDLDVRASNFQMRVLRFSQ